MRNHSDLSKEDFGYFSRRVKEATAELKAAEVAILNAHKWALERCACPADEIAYTAREYTRTDVKHALNV